MLNKIKLSLLSVGVLLASQMVLAPVLSAQSFEANQKVACEALSTTGGSCDEGNTGVKRVLEVALNILSIVVGIISVFMIIIAGLKYITSNGDSNAIGSAKNTIIYAVVGLVVVAFAQTIVQFVLVKVSK
jgi:hypothetical protein